MYQYGIEKENNVVFIDEKGQLTNRKNNQDSFDIISLSNTIELLKKDIKITENKFTKEFSDLIKKFLSYSFILVGSFLVGLALEFLVKYTYPIILICGFSSSTICSINSTIKYRKNRKNILEEFAQKIQLLDRYEKELNKALEKEKTEDIDKEDKPVDAYTFDSKKAEEACEKYVPVEKRRYFKKRELKRRH